MLKYLQIRKAIILKQPCLLFDKRKRVHTDYFKMIKNGWTWIGPWVLKASCYLMKLCKKSTSWTLDEAASEIGYSSQRKDTMLGPENQERSAFVLLSGKYSWGTPLGSKLTPLTNVSFLNILLLFSWFMQFSVILCLGIWCTEFPRLQSPGRPSQSMQVFLPPHPPCTERLWVVVTAKHPCSEVTASHFTNFTVQKVHCILEQPHHLYTPHPKPPCLYMI